MRTAAADDPAQDTDEIMAGVLEAYSAYFNQVSGASLLAAAPGAGVWMDAVQRFIMPPVLRAWGRQFTRWAGSVPARVRAQRQERYAAQVLERLQDGFPDYVQKLADQIKDETDDPTERRERLGALLDLDAPSLETRRRLDTLRARSVDDSLSSGERRRARQELDQLRDEVASNPDDRQWTPWARVVADTEAVGAFNSGTFEGNEEAGRTRKVWRSEHDARTRPSHRGADGQAVAIDQAFSVGGSRLMFPGDPTGPPDEVFNCRCRLEYR